MILLDTCSLIWLVSDQTQFSPPALRAVQDPSQSFAVSAISAFEIGILVRKRRITLSVPPEVWFADACLSQAVRVIDVSWEIALGSTTLPDIHNDPADRIIIASALWNGWPILTPDSKIAAYAGATTVW